jgi:hypothetical protein
LILLNEIIGIKIYFIFKIVNSVVIATQY